MERQEFCTENKFLAVWPLDDHFIKTGFFISRSIILRAKSLQLLHFQNCRKVGQKSACCKKNGHSNIHDLIFLLVAVVDEIVKTPPPPHEKVLRHISGVWVLPYPTAKKAAYVFHSNAMFFI